MLFRRFALAIGLVLAALASQLPEFTQQYRQRLGGALDELRTMVAQFDRDAADQSLTPDQAVARLSGSADPLVQGRGRAAAEVASRAARLQRQREAFATSGPLSEYAVLAEDFDTEIARHALSDFRPALPVTTGGFVAAALGFLVGWTLTHLAGRPLRRRRLIDHQGASVSA